MRNQSRGALWGAIMAAMAVTGDHWGSSASPPKIKSPNLDARKKTKRLMARQSRKINRGLKPTRTLAVHQRSGNV